MSLFQKITRSVSNNRLNNIGHFQAFEYPKFPLDKFTQLSTKKIDGLETAFLKLQSSNEIITKVGLSKNSDTLLVELVDIGTYKISADSQECFMYLSSPKSGDFTYFFNEKENLWQNTKDEHILDEFIVREFLKFTNIGGYLDL